MASIYHKGLKTENTDLMCCLTAVGIELDWTKPCEEILEDGKPPVVVWYFAPSSRDGKMDTMELIAAWDDDEWHLRHPRHPFAYLKVGMMNRKRGLDLVKSRSPIALIRKGDKNGFLSLNAAQKTQDLILGELRL